jgi:hypothetical protein
MTQLIVALRNFAIKPKNVISNTRCAKLRAYHTYSGFMMTAIEQYIDLLNITSEYSDI